MQKISSANSKQNTPLYKDRQVNKQFSQKVLNPLQKNLQLFDAIHNYLDNPKKPEEANKNKGSK